MGEDGGLCVVEIEGGVGLGHADIHFKEAANGSDIFPVAVEGVAADAALVEGLGQDIAAEIDEVLLQDVFQGAHVEDVDTH